MCGIAGILSRTPEPADAALARLLLDKLHHRGPDDTGLLYAQGQNARLTPAPEPGAVADTVLLFKRLAFLDLSPLGAQPMSFENRYHIVFNGEIYNYKELRQELTSLGHSFKSGSDTEVLLQGFARWGKALLPRLVGMFAFAVVDTWEKSVFLARDPFGIKPLYYLAAPERLVFASEIKVLLEMPGVKRGAEPQRLYEYLSFALTDYGDKTMFKDVSQLPAGHYLELSRQNLSIGEPQPYVSFNPEPNRDITFEEATEKLRELFFKNVRLHLRSDVPVGLTLSGGIDSSSIASVMRALEPNTPYQAFSFIANEKRYSEEHWIDLVAERKHLEVHKTIPTSDDLANDLRELVRVQDEPFANPSIFAQYHVFKLVQSRGVKAMMDGQGADEMLAGYPPYLGALFASFINRGQVLSAARVAAAGARRAGLKNMALYAGSFTVPERYQALPRRIFGFDLLPVWLNAEWFKARNVEVSNRAFATGRDSLRANLRYALTTTLPPLLRWEDRNSMAHSVESRVPFLTTELATFLLSLPEHYILGRDATSKRVFREAMRGTAPQEILDRRDKVGFATPRERWLKELDPWVTDLFTSERFRAMPMLKTDDLLSEWREVAAERKPFRPHIWRLVNLIAWADTYDVSF